MFFLDAFNSPVKLCVKASNGQRIIIHIPIFTLDQAVQWASEIRDEAYEKGMSELNESQRTEARLMYPPIQPDLQDVRRRIHTPEGIQKILKTTMVGAPSFAAMEIKVIKTRVPSASSPGDEPKTPPLELVRISYKEGKKLDPLNESEVESILAHASINLLTSIAIEASGAFQLKPAPSGDVEESGSPLADSASDEQNPSRETGGTNSSSSNVSTTTSTTAA